MKAEMPKIIFKNYHESLAFVCRRIQKKRTLKIPTLNEKEKIRTSFIK